MPPVIRKYEFDLSFDHPNPAQVARRRAAEDAVKAKAEAEALAHTETQSSIQVVEEQAPPPEPTFSAEDIQNAERTAYDRGMAEGEQIAFTRVEAQLAAATESLTFVLRDAAREQKSEMERVETQAAGLVMLCLKKMFPLCSTLSGSKEVEGLVREAFAQALDEPRILVRCAAALKDELESKVTANAAQAGYEGRLSVIGDPDLPETDCRVEWAAGGMSRDIGTFLAATEAAIRQAFPTVEVPEAPPAATMPAPAKTAPKKSVPKAKAPKASDPKAPDPRVPDIDISPVTTDTVEAGPAKGAKEIE